MERRTRMARTGQRWVAFAMLASCWICIAPPSWAERDEQKQGITLIDQANKELDGVAAHVRNAQVRMRKGFAGTATPTFGDPGANLTPAARCCSNNVETITLRLKGLHTAAGEMYRYYEQRGNKTALGIMGQMRMRLQQIAQGTIAFAQAQDEASASGALAGLVRPVNEFRNGLLSLSSCCPITDYEPPEDDGEEKKKDKKTKAGKGS